MNEYILDFITITQTTPKKTTIKLKLKFVINKNFLLKLHMLKSPINFLNLIAPFHLANSLQIPKTVSHSEVLCEKGVLRILQYRKTLALVSLFN